MTDYEACDGPCADCSRDKICCSSLGRPLCNDCWHTAREKLPPFSVRRIDTPKQIAQFGHCYGGGGTYLEQEAIDFAKELEERHGERERWEAIPTKSWSGGRIAHPGYMAERRSSVLATMERA
jgi:hypothetical protein